MAAQGCQLNAADWPHRMAPIRYLKYIGPLFTRRFRAMGIDTLQDLVDDINGHARAANERNWRAVFANARAQQCVQQTVRHQTKYWANPWPNDRNRIPRREHRELIAGDYEYCVRNYNRCGWESAAHYLRGQADVTAARIPRFPERRHWCRPNDWCRQQQPRRRSTSSESISSTSSDNRGNQPPPRQRSLSRSRSPSPDYGSPVSPASRSMEDYSMESAADQEPQEVEFEFSADFEHPMTAGMLFNEACRRIREFRNIFDNRLTDLSNKEKAAYVLWKMSQLAPDGAAEMDSATLARGVGLEKKTITTTLNSGVRSDVFDRVGRGKFKLSDRLLEAESEEELFDLIGDRRRREQTQKLLRTMKPKPKRKRG